MKKTLITVVSTLALAMGLVSCAPVASNDSNLDGGNHVAEVVDLRNYKGSTVSFLPAPAPARSARSARAAEPGNEFSYELVDFVPRFIGENGVEINHASHLVVGDNDIYDVHNDAEGKYADVKDKKVVVIADDPKGVKFTFNRPTAYRNTKFEYINVQFLDKVGHKSTGIYLPDDKLDDTNDKPYVELVYPLVDPESTEETRFWVQYKIGNCYADLTFKVVPVHGEGCVKPVQPDYRIRDYLELSEDGVMTLKLTVPPVAKNGTLKHKVGFYMQKGSGPAYTEGAGQPEGIDDLSFFEAATDEEVEAAENGTVYEYKVDFKDMFENKLDDYQRSELLAKLESNPYVWASLIYSYEIPGDAFNGMVFDTPWVISNVVANPFEAPSSAE